MKVYPWRQVDNQGDRKMVMKIVTSTAVVFRIVGGLLSLGVASVVGLLLVRRFAKRNDSWIKRGGLMTLIGLIVFVALGGPALWAGSLSDLLMSFGNKVDISPFAPLFGFIIRTIAFGFFFQGFAVMMASYVYEVTGSRYLDRIRPTRKMKKRYKKNEADLIQNEKPAEETIAFGLLVDDPIPWRTARYGMICGRPFKEMGHGVIVGGNGTGKTVLALSIAYQAVQQDAAAFYIDFKASLRTLESLKKAAAKAGKKFYSFDLGTGSRESSWYDPLDWKGTASEKASMIVNSLHFTEEGSASYYRGQANDWLIFQFEVLNEVGLFPGESSFDYLHETTNPVKMKDRLRALKSGDERQQSLYKPFMDKADQFKPQDLTALRQNLSVVVNSGGERLRPQSGAPAILMSRAVEEGAVVYFGLSPATDHVALKVIGSLILRNLGVLSGERMRDANLSSLRPIVTLVDEASRLQDRAEVMDNLFATSREAEIYLWSITQSFSTWPKSTVVEMNTNVQTHVAFRVQDVETAELLVDTLAEVPVLEEMVEDKVRHRAFQGDVKERSGDGRTTLSSGPFLVDAPMEITSIENLHAYVWFTGSWSQATIEKWKSKRLKKPDTIRNDAPLVRIVFMDYETEAEPLQGSSFSDLVTSADQITYNMENTTLKRARKESLTDDDYSNIHLPGAVGDGVQWGEEPAGVFGGYGPEQGSGNELGGSQGGAQPEPMWGEPSGPRWDDPAPTNMIQDASTSQVDADGLSWAGSSNDGEAEAPPVSYFYKGGKKAPSVPSESMAPSSQSPVPSGAEFADDAPIAGQEGPRFDEDVPASVEVDDDGLQWDVSPTSGSAASASSSRGDASLVRGSEAPVDEGFAPERGEASGVSESSEFVQEETPQRGAVSAVDGGASDADEGTGSQDGAPVASEGASGLGEGDVATGAEYVGSSVPDPIPASPDGDASSVDAVIPEKPQGAPAGTQWQGRTPSVSPTSGDSASTASADTEGETASASGSEVLEQGEAGVPPRPVKKSSKAPSRNTPKRRSKKNASDDWL